MVGNIEMQTLDERSRVRVYAQKWLECIEEGGREARKETAVTFSNIAEIMADMNYCTIEEAQEYLAKKMKKPWQEIKDIEMNAIRIWHEGDENPSKELKVTISFAPVTG